MTDRPDLTYERDAEFADDVAVIMAQAAHGEFRYPAKASWHALNDRVRDRWIGEQRAAIAAAERHGYRFVRGA